MNDNQGEFVRDGTINWSNRGHIDADPDGIEMEKQNDGK